MANKTKPAKAKRHTNPKGRVALFCYVTKRQLAAIKRNVDKRCPALRSQGHVVGACVMAVEQFGSYKRPIA